MLLSFLTYLQNLAPVQLWALFFAENILVCLLSISAGQLISWYYNFKSKSATPVEYIYCFVTILINTAITYLGFYLWDNGVIKMDITISWAIIPHFIILILAMHLLMFIFHYAIHHSFAYKYIHQLHHRFDDPSPIDLYVLHPLETVGFGSLWLITIALFNFNMYAVFIYLIFNVGFGIVGHLGFEPFSDTTKKHWLLKYLGTSTFHHNHHLDIDHNYGFYTNIWDKMFRTFKG